MPSALFRKQSLHVERPLPWALGLKMSNHLSKFSQGVAVELFNAFPEMKEFESVTENDGEVALYVEVIPPTGDAENPLRISTLRGEITVSFDAYHAHFEDFRNAEGDDAYSMLQRIISDQFAVVSYWRDEQWCGSTLLGKAEFPSDNAEYPYANRVEFKSWRGGLDGSIACAPRG